VSRFVYTIIVANYNIPYSLEQRWLKGNKELKIYNLNCKLGVNSLCLLIDNESMIFIIAPSYAIIQIRIMKGPMLKYITIMSGAK
jgi:hypothetical protein